MISNVPNGKPYPLFDLVTERPDPALTVDAPVCPWGCEDPLLEIGEACGTLVGGDPDPNHYWLDSQCHTCTRIFCLEHREGNVWYTAGHYHGRRGAPQVLLGMPSCWEGYTYTCKVCGDQIGRRYRDLDEDKPLEGPRVSTLGGAKEYRTEYHCRACGARQGVEKDYWVPRLGVPEEDGHGD